MRSQPESDDARAQRARWWNREPQPYARVGMIEGELRGVQRQTMKAVMLAKVSIVLSLAVLHVTDDRTGDVLQVLADLMHAPGARNGFDEGVASGRSETSDARHRGNPRPVFTVHDRMVDISVFGVTAGQRDIAFFDPTLFERLAEHAR